MSSEGPSSYDLRLLRKDLEGLRAQLDRLATRLDRLELAAERSAPTPLVAQADAHPTMGRSQSEPPVDVEVIDEVPEARPATSPPAIPSFPPVGASGDGPLFGRASDDSTWEKVVGQRWMTWLGTFTLIVALAFTVQWAWSTFETPPWLQVLGLHLGSLGLLVAAHLLHKRRLALLAEGLAGLGIFALYTTAFATLHLYQFWDPKIAFIEGVVITVVAVAIAVRANSIAIVLLGALGGYLTPLVASTGSGDYVGWFSYLAFLNAALVGAAIIRGWSFLKPLALAATAAMFALWVLSSHFDGDKVWGTQWLAILHGLIFLAGSTIPPVVWQRPSNRFDLMALSSSSLGFMGLSWYLFHNRPEQQLALVSWGMSLLHLALFGLTYARVTNVDRMPRVHLALAAVFFTLAIPLQLDNALYWGVTWCTECLIFTIVGLWFRDRQMCATAVAVAIVGAVRLIGFDFRAEPQLIADSQIDLRAAMFTLGGLMTMFAAGMYWVFPAFRQWNSPLDQTEDQSRRLLLAIGSALLVLAPLLQLQDYIYLGPVWSCLALAFCVAGLLLRDGQLSLTGGIVFILAAGRLFGWDFHAEPQTIGDFALDQRFAVIAFSSLLGMITGALHWPLVRRQPVRRDAITIEQAVMAALLAGGNIALLVGMLCQWHDRTVLFLWTLDAAIIWAIGFSANQSAVRWYAAALAIVLVGGRAIYEGDNVSQPFALLLNDRFQSLACVAALYLTAGWCYRRLEPHEPASATPHGAIFGMRSEPLALGEPLLGRAFTVIGSLVLVASLSLEIHSWFASAARAGQKPFPDMWMAEMASYSILWAVYAAVLVAVGFVLRDPLFRILGLLAFVPIVAKVFLVDLSRLQLLPRVLALAVLGLMLLGVSFLYQRFMARIEPKAKT